MNNLPTSADLNPALSLLRLFMQFLAGAASLYGYMDGATATTAAGLGTSLVVGLWSQVVQRRKNAAITGTTP